MKLTATLEVLKKDTKTGTSKSGSDYSINEYVLKCVEKRDDNTDLETLLSATTSDRVGDLTVGATYECSIFINGRDYNGRVYNSFRITFAKKVSDAPAQAAEPVAEEVSASEPVGVADDIPF